MSNFKRLVDEARVSLEEKSFGKSLAAAKAALALPDGKDSAPLLVLAGDAALGARDYELAVSMLQRASELEPSLMAPLVKLGQALSSLGLHARVAEVKERQLLLVAAKGNADKLPALCLELARALELSRQPRAALAAYERLLSLLGPDPPESVVLAEGSERLVAAEGVLRIVYANVWPDSPPALVARCSTLLVRGKVGDFDADRDAQQARFPPAVAVLQMLPLLPDRRQAAAALRAARAGCCAPGEAASAGARPRPGNDEALKTWALCSGALLLLALEPDEAEVGAEEAVDVALAVLAEAAADEPAPPRARSAGCALQLAQARWRAWAALARCCLAGARPAEARRFSDLAVLHMRTARAMALADREAQARIKAANEAGVPKRAAVLSLGQPAKAETEAEREDRLAKERTAAHNSACEATREALLGTSARLWLDRAGLLSRWFAAGGEGRVKDAALAARCAKEGLAALPLLAALPFIAPAEQQQRRQAEDLAWAARPGPSEELAARIRTSFGALRDALQDAALENDSAVLAEQGTRAAREAFGVASTEHARTPGRMLALASWQVHWASVTDGEAAAEALTEGARLLELFFAPSKVDAEPDWDPNGVVRRAALALLAFARLLQARAAGGVARADGPAAALLAAARLHAAAAAAPAACASEPSLASELALAVLARAPSEATTTGGGVPRVTGTLPWYLAVQGMVAAELGSADAAHAALLRAVQLDGSLAEAFQVLGDLYMFAKRDAAKAVRCWDKAAQLRPAWPPPLERLCAALPAEARLPLDRLEVLLRRATDTAADLSHKGSDVAPPSQVARASQRAWLGLARLRLLSGEFAASAAAFQSAVAVSGDAGDGAGWAGQGEAYLRMGRLTAAALSFETAVPLLADRALEQAHALFRAGRLAALGSRHEHAQDMLRRARALAMAAGARGGAVSAGWALAHSQLASALRCADQGRYEASAELAFAALAVVIGDEPARNLGDDVLARAVSSMGCTRVLQGDLWSLLACGLPADAVASELRATRLGAGETAGWQALCGGGGDFELARAPQSYCDARARRAFAKRAHQAPWELESWLDLARHSARFAQQTLLLTLPAETSAAAALARRSAEIGVALSPTDSGAWNLLGCALLQLAPPGQSRAACESAAPNDWALVQHCLVRAVQLDSGNAEAWCNLAALFELHGLDGPARAALVNGQAGGKNAAAVWAARARIAMRDLSSGGGTVRAEPLCRPGGAGTPSAVRAALECAVAAAGAGARDTANAQAYLLQAAWGVCSSAASSGGAASKLAARRAPEEWLTTLEAARRAAARDPAAPLGPLLAGIALRALGDRRGARVQLERAEALFPGVAPAGLAELGAAFPSSLGRESAVAVADALLRSGRVAEARDVLQTVVLSQAREGGFLDLEATLAVYRAEPTLERADTCLRVEALGGSGIEAGGADRFVAAALTIGRADHARSAAPFVRGAVLRGWLASELALAGAASAESAPGAASTARQHAKAVLLAPWDPRLWTRAAEGSLGALRRNGMMTGGLCAVGTAVAEAARSSLPSALACAHAARALLSRPPLKPVAGSPPGLEFLLELALSASRARLSLTTRAAFVQGCVLVLSGRAAMAVSEASKLVRAIPHSADARRLLASAALAEGVRVRSADKARAARAMLLTVLAAGAVGGEPIERLLDLAGRCECALLLAECSPDTDEAKASGHEAATVAAELVRAATTADNEAVAALGSVYFARAELAISGDLAAAAGRYREALRCFPDSPLLWTELALALAAQPSVPGARAAAEHCFECASQCVPLPEAMNEDEDGASGTAAAALPLVGATARLRQALYISHVSGAKAAMQLMGNVARAYPSNAKVSLVRGWLQLQAGSEGDAKNVKKALGFLRRALEQEPGWPLALRAVASLDPSTKAPPAPPPRLSPEEEEEELAAALAAEAEALAELGEDDSERP